MTRTYSRWKCPVCKRTMSANGLARTNHCRKHVREGKMIERHIPMKGHLYLSEIYFDVIRKPKPPPAPELAGAGAGACGGGGEQEVSDA